MKLLLTDRFCDRAKAQGAQTDYFDETVSGLALRVSRGRKSWTLHYTRDGTRARLTFGTYPAISLAAARRKAIEAKTEIAEGRSPAPAMPDTLQAICEEYFGREGPRLRNLSRYDRTLKRLVYVLSANLHRRHLNESQRAMVGAKLTSYDVGANQHTKGTSIDVASKLLNVGRASIDRARKVLSIGNPSLVQSVEQGEVSVSAAAAAATPSETSQTTSPTRSKKNRSDKVDNLANRLLSELKEWKKENEDTAVAAASNLVNQLRAADLIVEEKKGKKAA